jgi:hypothetical protein
MPAARNNTRRAARANANNNNGENAAGANGAPPPNPTPARGGRAGAGATAAPVRPTVAGMRALQEQLETQQKESADLREQLRETVANLNANGNQQGGGEQRASENEDNLGQQGNGGGGHNQGLQSGDQSRQLGPGDAGTGESQDVAALRMDMNDRFSSILAAINRNNQQTTGVTTGFRTLTGSATPFGNIPNVTHPFGQQAVFGAQPSYGLPPLGATGGQPAGGESEIAVHFTGLAKKDLANIMEGNIEPSKIYHAIPTDSDLYPKPDLEEKAPLEMDNKGQLVVLDNSKAQEDERQLND